MCARGAYHFSLGGVPGRRAMACDRRDLPSYLYRVANQRLTGVFVVRNGERARRVFFHDGSVEFVSSTDAAQLLGEMLTSQGVIDADEVDDCLVEAAETERRIGEVLTGRGHVRASSLARVLRQQQEERLATMFGWTSASLAFVPGERSGEPPVAGGESRGLISAAVRTGFQDDDLAHALSPLRNAALRPAGDGEQETQDPTILGLTAPELRCLRLVLSGGVRAATPLRQVVETCRNERLCRGREALLALFIGLSAGLVSAS